MDQHRLWDLWDLPEDLWDLWHQLTLLYQERLVHQWDLCPTDPWDLWLQCWLHHLLHQLRPVRQWDQWDRHPDLWDRSDLVLLWENRLVARHRALALPSCWDQL